LTCAVVCASPLQRSDVVRELVVRDRAHSASIASSLVEDGWSERATTLDAFERRLGVGVFEPTSAAPALLVDALDHEHPNVRALAFSAMAHVPSWAAIHMEPARLSKAGGALLPEERAAAVRAATAALRGGAPARGFFGVVAALLDSSQPETVRRASFGFIAVAAAEEPAIELWSERIAADWDEDRALRESVWALLAEPPPREACLAIAAEVPAEPAAVLSALATVGGAPLEIERLLADWPAGFGDRTLFEAVLSSALLAADRASIEGYVTRALELELDDPLQAVMHAVGPQPLLDRLPSVDEDTARRLLDALGSGVRWQWTEAQARALSVRRDLPAETVEALSRAVVFDHPPAVAALAKLFSTFEPEVARSALRLMAPAQVSEHADAIAAAWDRAGRPIDWVGRFGDTGPAPAFRPGLLELASTPDGQRATVARALARFEGDAEVATLLEGWIAREADEVEASGAPLESLAATVAALARVDAVDSVPALAALLPRFRGNRSIERELVRALGRSDAGLRVVVAELGAEGWHPEGLDEARVLAFERGALDDYELGLLVDRVGKLSLELEGRFFAALVTRADASSMSVLLEVADAGESESLRIRALGALGGFGEQAVPALEARFGRNSSHDVRIAVAGALGRAAAWPAIERLLDVLDTGAPWPQGFAVPVTDEARELLADELRIVLARAGRPWSDPTQGLLFDLSQEAASVVERRFDRRPVEGVELMLYAELPTLRAWDDPASLVRELEASGPWWRGDGRALAACSTAVAGAPESARSLSVAAEIALRGEPGSERGALGRSSAASLRHSLELEDWAAAGRIHARWIADLGTGSLGREDLVAAFGPGSPADGSLPLADLAVWRDYCFARAALERGESEAARIALGRARSRRGSPASTSEALLELAARLED
jgi:hypothetical protein